MNSDKKTFTLIGLVFIALIVHIISQQCVHPNSFSASCLALKQEPQPPEIGNQYSLSAVFIEPAAAVGTATIDMPPIQGFQYNPRSRIQWHPAYGNSTTEPVWNETES